MELSLPAVPPRGLSATSQDSGVPGEGCGSSTWVKLTKPVVSGAKERRKAGILLTYGAVKASRLTAIKGPADGIDRSFGSPLEEKTIIAACATAISPPTV